MKVSELEKLLARYYEGETTGAEERELKRFFAEEDVPAHLLAEKEFFLQLDTACSGQEAGVPEGMEHRLNRKIDEWDTRERREGKVKKRMFSLRLQRMGSIAAGLLILFSVGMYLYRPYQVPTAQDTCATPEEAYVQARKALVLLSSSLNKGIKEMESVQETAGRIQENVNEQLNRINNIKP